MMKLKKIARLPRKVFIHINRKAQDYFEPYGGPVFLLQSFLHFLLHPKAKRIFFVNWFGNNPNEFINQVFYQQLQQTVPNLTISSWRPHAVFHSVFGPREKVYRAYRKSKKIFYTGENVQRSQFTSYADHCLGEVDLAIGFEHIDHPDYVRYPLWLMFLQQDRKLSQESITSAIEQINATQSEGKRFCAMIANHDETGIRRKMIDAIEAAIEPIACPGKMYHNDDTLQEMEKDGKTHKLDYLRQFKFTICPENTATDGYVTEKIFHAFQAGVIPIYWGASSDPEPGIFNPKAILFWHQGEDHTELINKIRELNKSEKKRLEFLSQPKFLTDVENKISGLVELAFGCLVKPIDSSKSFQIK